MRERMSGRQAIPLAGAVLMGVSWGVAGVPDAFAAKTVPSCASLATSAPLAGNALILTPVSTVVAAAGNNKSYCKITFTYSSRGGTANGYADGESQTIGIGIGLPLNSADGGTGGVQGNWNGKIENLGGGGLIGSVGSTTSATNASYVGSSTDGGHTSAQNGQRGNFGVIQATNQLDLGKIDDYIYQAQWQQVVWAKKLAKVYYNQQATRNYWNGCSTGGRQGLALAMKHGADFDGFVVGAPATWHEEFRLSDAWPYLVVKDNLTPKGKTLTTAQVAAANASAVAACSTLGDGYIDDPRACTFDASANICGQPGAPSAPNCLDADQAAAMNMIWKGPTNESGHTIWFPFDRGASIGVGFATLPSSAAQVMSWDHKDLNYDTTLLYSSQAAIAAAGNPPGATTIADEMTLATNTTGTQTEMNDFDLDNVKNNGGKMIMWQGTADQLIRWRDSVDFYEHTATAYGDGVADFNSLSSWFRYFHAPGATHCSSGVGAQPDDVFGALVNWVENGVAPDQLIATGGTGHATRKRPLCPWPTTAIYNGSGSTDDPANFTCGGDLDSNHTALCTMLRANYKKENLNGQDSAQIDVDPAICKNPKLR
jgi:hypothetical protein